MLHNYLYNENEKVLTTKKSSHTKEFISTKREAVFCPFSTFAIDAKASEKPIEYLKQHNIVEVVALC